VVLSPDGDLGFWDVASGKQTVQLAGRFKGISDSGRLILGEGAGGDIELWDSVTRRVITTLPEQKGSPTAVACSSDDRFIACADREGALRVWEVATGRLQGMLPTMEKSAVDLWFPDGVEGLVLGFQPRSGIDPGRPLFTLRTLGDFTQNSTLRSSDAFRFWDLQLDRKMEALPKNVRRFQQTYEDEFSLNLVCDGHRGVRVESARLMNCPRLLSFLPVPSGRMMIVGGERDITLWEIETGRRVATLAGHGGWVHGLALSPDGRLLASAANDGTLKLWNLALRKEVITLPGQMSPYSRKVSFAPDGNSIAVLSYDEDRTVRFFHAPSLKEIEQVEASKKALNSPP